MAAPRRAISSTQLKWHGPPRCDAPFCRLGTMSSVNPKRRCFLSNLLDHPSGLTDLRIATFGGRPRPRELNHLFVNNVRFWSMLSVIVVHSWYVFGSANSGLDIALVTPFKFATIGFFLISGFLLGERVDRRNPVEYFLRRFRRVFVPW